MEAFKAGYDAYLAGTLPTANPYPKHTEERVEWFLGFDCAKADTEYE